MTAPRHLSALPISPWFNKAACDRVDKVYVDGEHVKDCLAYDMDAGWALPKGDGAVKYHGVVRVTEKP